MKWLIRVNKFNARDLHEVEADKSANKHKNFIDFVSTEDDVSLVSRVSALEARPTGPFHSSPRPSMRGRSFNCDSNILNESPPPGFDLGASGVNRPRIPPPPAENGCQEEPAVRRHLALPSGPHVQPNSDIPERLAIVGRAKRADGPGLLRVVPKFKWLFVTRLSREVTSEQLAEFLAQNLSSKRSPQCFSLIPRGDTTRRVASFKVALMPDEFHEAMSEEFWDLGIFVSEFTFRPFRWGRGGPLLPDRGQGLDEGERVKPGESSSPAAEDDARAIGNSAGPGGDGGSNAGES
ncbi:Zinc finger, PHD-type, conserved site [Sergentomyia squamirostris]